MTAKPLTVQKHNRVVGDEKQFSVLIFTDPRITASAAPQHFPSQELTKKYHLLKGQLDLTTQLRFIQAFLVSSLHRYLAEDEGEGICNDPEC